MKTLLKKSIFLIATLPIFLVGCEKSQLNDSSKNTDVEKSTLTYCGTPMITNIYEQEQNGSGIPGTTSYGTVTVSNDADNLYVAYDLIDGWEINYTGPAYRIGINLFVGTQAQLEAIHALNVFGVNNSVHIIEDLLPYEYMPTVPGVTEYTFIIPRSAISVDCPLIVTSIDIRNSSTGEVKGDLSAMANTKCYAYYFQYCMQSCGGNETAYAKADDGTCFLTLAGVNSNNWGWSNMVSAPGTYYWPIWAGAGQCNTGNGTEVGKLKVVYASGQVTVTYNLYGGFHLDETHLWVGKTYLPVNKKGNYITAPGQFGNTQSGLNGVSTYTYSPITISTPFYIAAHSVVYW